MRAWEIVSDGGVDALALNERPAPEPGQGQVLVNVSASSVNYRDLSTIDDPVSRNLPYPTVPNSDAAGEIIAIGKGVEGINVGDLACRSAGPCHHNPPLVTKSEEQSTLAA